MLATCPKCGAVSHDLEFCDRCNADLAPPGTPLPPAVCQLDREQVLQLTAEQQAHLSRPESAILTRVRRHQLRIHWIARSLWPRWQAGIEDRCRVICPALAPCRCVEVEEGVWLIVEASGRWAHPWVRPACSDPIDELRRMTDFLGELSQALEKLRQAGFCWWAFDPRDLEYAPRSRGLRFTNLDLQLHPLNSPVDQLSSCNPQFVAPEQVKEPDAVFGGQSGAAGSASLTVYHLALYAFYWLARLLPGGFPGRGLEALGHRLPALRIYCPRLPAGIAHVLSRGLSVDPHQRQADAAELLADLRSASDRATDRLASKAPVTWEVAGHTRTGRAKEAQGGTNEDAILIRQHDNPPRALAAVADGISTCDVGTGSLASLLTCLALDNTFDLQSSDGEFQTLMTSACRRAAENLLSWAMEHGKQKILLDGGDLMGTTLTAAWLQGQRLQLAHLGDSRAYLFAGSFLEQLTVDGDLGASLLAAGTPPENLIELGELAHGLRECVGGCDRTAEGTLTLAEHYNHPQFSEWILQPGDIVILCSDGLVEEGHYLDQAALEKLLRDHTHRPAQELAVLLADAADALQRLPTPLEPEGRGDNISCLVIKIGC
jgi:protein phosphatase